MVSLLSKERRLNNPGFGRPWSAPTVYFRVELNREMEDGQERCLAIHWIAVRNLQKKERDKYLDGFQLAGEPLDSESRESVESRLCLTYVTDFLEKEENKRRYNQAFIYPCRRPRDRTIRYPLYYLDTRGMLPLASTKRLKAILNTVVWTEAVENVE